MRILLTNDDGIFAPGLAALAQELAPMGDLYIAAPATEQSGVAHGITFLSALKAKEVYVQSKFWGWAVEGTPADCVRIGVQSVYDVRPDLVVSGINSGWNAGVNIHYSGTCAAAREALLFGINSFAVSIQSDKASLYRPAAALFRQIIEQTLAHDTGKKRMYNINAPNETIRLFAQGQTPVVKTVSVDNCLFGERLKKQTSPFGLPYFWCEANRPLPEELTPGADIDMLQRGFVTITPIEINPTDREMARQMDSWSWNIETAAVPPIDEDAQNEGLDAQTLNPERVPAIHARRIPKIRIQADLPTED